MTLFKLLNDVRGSWTEFVQQCRSKYQVNVNNLRYWRVRRLKCQLQVRSGNIADLKKNVVLDPCQIKQESGPFRVHRGRIPGVFGQAVLVTKPFCTSSRDVEQVLLEQCVFWSHLRHQKILQLVGIDRDSISPIINRDLVEGSQSLRDRANALIEKKKEVPADNWVSVYLLRSLCCTSHGRCNHQIPQILEALNYLHTQGIVHGLLSGVSGVQRCDVLCLT